MKYIIYIIMIIFLLGSAIAISEVKIPGIWVNGGDTGAYPWRGFEFKSNYSAYIVGIFAYPGYCGATVGEIGLPNQTTLVKANYNGCTANFTIPFKIDAYTTYVFFSNHTGNYVMGSLINSLNPDVYSDIGNITRGAYNNGGGWAYDESGQQTYGFYFIQDDLVFEDPTPADNQANNIQQSFNLSCLGSTGNVSLWLDTNADPTTVRINNLSTVANWTSDVIPGTYYYKGSCDSGSINSSIRTWYYDTSSPDIILNSDNIFNGSNYTSNVNNYLTTFSMNFTDNNDLFTFKIQVNNSANNTYFEYTNSTLNGTLENYYISFSNFNWSDGNYTTYIWLTDSGLNTIEEDYIFTLIRTGFLDNCSNSYAITSNATTLTFSLFDENYPLIPRNGNAEIEIYYGVGFTNNYTTRFAPGHNFTICIYPAYTSLQANLYLKYTDAFTHSFFLNNYSLSNDTTRLNIFNWNQTDESADLRITVRDIITYGYFKNVYVQLQRKYIDEGIWRTVQMERSGNFGLIFFNIKEEDTDYRLKYFDDNNNLIKETGSMKFSCTSGLCEYTELLDPYTVIILSPELNVWKTVDNATSILTIYWEDTTMRTSNVRIKVTKETLTGTATICDSNADGYTGNYACNTSGYTGDLLLRVWSSASPETPKFSEWIKITTAAALDSLVGKFEGAFWSFGIILTTAGAGALLGPIGGIIMTLVGMIATLFLGTFSGITITALIIAAVIGIAIGLKVKQ